MSVETDPRAPLFEGPASPTGETLYDRDFARWASREAALLRAGRFSDIDLTNLAEEVESLGREQYGKFRGTSAFFLRIS